MPESITANPGKWISTKYQIGIHNSFHENKKRIALMKSERVGGTRSLINIILYCIEQDPCSQIIYFPTDEDAREFSKDDLDKTLLANPEILKIIDTSPVSANRKKSRDTILQKQYPGGNLYLSGVTSPVSLRRLTVKNVFFDECSSFVESSHFKGDPFDLGEARAKTYGDDARIFYVSTPGNEDTCRITKVYQSSDQRKFFVPCPLCKNPHVLLWENLRFGEEEGGPKNPKFKCPNCKKLIDEKFKHWMIANGEWQATVREPKDDDTIGFWIWEAYSPYSSWRDIVKRFLDSKDYYERSKAFTNGVLAKVWADYGETLAWRKIYARRSGKQKVLPLDKKFILVAGADVQDDRIEISVYSFSKDRNICLIEHKIIHGSPHDKETWVFVDEFLRKGYDQYKISTVAIDSGYATNQVYNFCTFYDQKQVIAVKGSSQSTAPAILPGKYIDVRQGNKVIFEATRLFMVGVDTIKDEIFWLLKDDAKQDFLPKDERKYHFHFPDMSEEFFLQLTAEGKVKTKNLKGEIIYSYKRNRDRNEALDCLVYAFSAYYFRQSEFEPYLYS